MLLVSGTYCTDKPGTVNNILEKDLLTAEHKTNIVLEAQRINGIAIRALQNYFKHEAEQFSKKQHKAALKKAHNKLSCKYRAEAFTGKNLSFVARLCLTFLVVYYLDNYKLSEKVTLALDDSGLVEKFKLREAILHSLDENRSNWYEYFLQSEIVTHARHFYDISRAFDRKEKTFHILFQPKAVTSTHGMDIPGYSNVKLMPNAASTQRLNTYAPIITAQTVDAIILHEIAKYHNASIKEFSIQEQYIAIGKATENFRLLHTTLLPESSIETLLSRGFLAVMTGYYLDNVRYSKQIDFKIYDQGFAHFIDETTLRKALLDSFDKFRGNWFKHFQETDIVKTAALFYNIELSQKQDKSGLQISFLKKISGGKSHTARKLASNKPIQQPIELINISFSAPKSVESSTRDNSQKRKRTYIDSEALPNKRLKEQGAGTKRISLAGTSSFTPPTIATIDTAHHPKEPKIEVIVISDDDKDETDNTPSPYRYYSTPLNSSRDIQTCTTSSTIDPAPDQQLVITPGIPHQHPKALKLSKRNPSQPAPYSPDKTYTVTPAHVHNSGFQAPNKVAEKHNSIISLAALTIPQPKPFKPNQSMASTPSDASAPKHTKKKIDLRKKYFSFPTASTVPDSGGPGENDPSAISSKSSLLSFDLNNISRPIGYNQFNQLY